MTEPLFVLVSYNNLKTIELFKLTLVAIDNIHIQKTSSGSTMVMTPISFSLSFTGLPTMECLNSSVSLMSPNIDDNFVLQITFGVSFSCSMVMDFSSNHK